MASPKKQRPASEWRYCHIEDPLFILEKNGRETCVEFIGGRITHEMFTVRIREHWHTFKFNGLYAYKTQIFDETWISEIAYYSLLAMAEHVMRAIFASFQPRSRNANVPLTVIGENVRLLTLRQGLLTFRWQKEEYTITLLQGEPYVEGPPDKPLPPELRQFFIVFVTNIWPKLPEYRTPEQIEQDRAAKVIARAAPLPLFDDAPAVYRKPKRKTVPKKHPTPIQLSLLNR